MRRHPWSAPAGRPTREANESEGSVRMSKAALKSVIKRAQKDLKFGEFLSSSPDAALRGYDLTPEEVTALVSQDSAKLRACGLDDSLCLFSPKS